MSFFEYTFLALSSLFVIIDPFAAIPAFLAMTPTNTPRERIEMAWLASVVAGGALIGFALVGKWIFGLLGITLPAFQIAGSIVLLLVALDMLRAQRSRVKETEEEMDAGAVKEDIAITPLGIPMLAGPGAISTAILLENKAQGALQEIVLIFAIIAVCGVTYWILRISAHGSRWLSPIALRLTTRIMGLILAAVAIQFALNALKDLKVIPA